MVDTGAGQKDIFRHIEQIDIADIHHQAHGYFELIGIGNVGNKFLLNPLVLSALKKLYQNPQEVKKYMTR